MNIEAFFNQNIFQNRHFSITVEELSLSVLAIVVTFVVSFLFRKFLVRKSAKTMVLESVNLRIVMVLNFILRLSAFSFILTTVLRYPNRFFNFILVHFSKVKITVQDVFLVLFAYLITRLVIYIIQKVFNTYTERKTLDVGMSNSVFQILKYILWVATFAFMLDTIGLNITVVLAGSAALLVGIGMGLQQIFNDVVSGLILLFEQNLKLKDVVEVGGIVGEVRRIGIRTSTVVTTDNIEIIMPNSKFVSEKLINWHNTDEKVRFFVNVNVGYESDLELVQSVLLACTDEIPDILKEPKPFVRFKSFGDYFLEFQIYFWTSKVLPNEDIKSLLRFAISRKFTEKGIKIPVPQRDIYVRTDD